MNLLQLMREKVTFYALSIIVLARNASMLLQLKNICSQGKVVILGKLNSMFQIWARGEIKNNVLQ